MNVSLVSNAGLAVERNQTQHVALTGQQIRQLPRKLRVLDRYSVVPLILIAKIVFEKDAFPKIGRVLSSRIWECHGVCLLLQTPCLFGTLVRV